MKKILLNKIRLSWYFGIFFIVYFIALFFLPSYKFDSGALALFSVNSFLYGFYISPILRGQKKRIDDLAKAVRAEANAIFAIMLAAKHLPEKTKDEFKALIEDYLKLTSERKAEQAELAYEKIVTWVVEYKGKYREDVDDLLKEVIENQENRSDYQIEVSNKIYSNEWMIMMVLFLITLSFILLMDSGDSLAIHTITAFLCTGLSMLMLILVKLDTMTHKKAKGSLKPFKTLVDSNFYHIDTSIQEHDKH